MISKKTFLITCVLAAGLAVGWNVSLSISGDVPQAAEAEMIRMMPPDEEGWSEDIPVAPEEAPFYQGEETPLPPTKRILPDTPPKPVPQTP
jgi:hypothetical protein